MFKANIRKANDILKKYLTNNQNLNINHNNFHHKNSEMIFQNRILTRNLHNLKIFRKFSTNKFDLNYFQKKIIIKFPKFHFSKYSDKQYNFMQNNNNFTKLNKSLNHDLLFTIFEQCELEPKNEGYHIRLRICPLCEKPHNCDKSNLNTCCINAENNLFNCFRCGNKGHVIRILKLLRRQYNLEIINDLFDSEKYSSTENEDTGKRMKMEDYSVNDNRDKYKANSGKINNPPNSSDFDNPKDNSSKRFSDFSDLECYKVNKNHPISSGNNSPIQTNEYDLNYDENNSFSEHEPENVNNKDYKTENKKLTLTSQKNGKKNDTVKINADESKMDILEKSKNPFSTNSNIFNSWDVKNLNSNTSSKIGSGNFNSNADKNKQEIKISPITSISGVNFNEGLKNTVSAFKISINNINLINELYKRIKLLDDEKHLIVKDYLENDRKINEDVLKFYKIGVSFEKFKNTDFDFINLPTVSFPMFYSTDNASYLGVDKNNLRNEVFEYLNCDNFFLSRIKIRAIGKEFKNFMKIEPAGAVIWYDESFYHQFSLNRYLKCFSYIFFKSFI